MLLMVAAAAAVVVVLPCLLPPTAPLSVGPDVGVGVAAALLTSAGALFSSPVLSRAASGGTAGRCKHLAAPPHPDAPSQRRGTAIITAPRC